MAAHKGPASLRPRCTRTGSSVAAITVYQSTRKMDLELRKKPVKCYIWSVALYGDETGYTLGNRSETPGKF
jgi:hypothetical protein